MQDRLDRAPNQGDQSACDSDDHARNKIPIVGARPRPEILYVHHRLTVPGSGQDSEVVCEEHEDQEQEEPDDYVDGDLGEFLPQDIYPILRVVLPPSRARPFPIYGNQHSLMFVKPGRDGIEATSEREEVLLDLGWNVHGYGLLEVLPRDSRQPSACQRSDHDDVR